MAIPDEKIEEVRAAADLVEVAEDYVNLKRSGKRYMGRCPFHDDSTPSFSVEPDKNLFYCFGCQKGGDVFKFVQEMEGVGFLESIRILAERYGVPLPDEQVDTEAANEREAILHTLRFAARFFYHTLTQTSRGKPALRYLKDRGFRPKTIKKFGLGFAPDEWDALLNAAKKKEIEPELLEKAGLVIERNDGSGYYDRYRGRVIFPIFSHIGKVLGFAGRILDTDRDQPKYINSPETRVYHKKEVLYGLHQAKRWIRQEEEVLMVEGYTDVISLWQNGVQNAVASSGTALTEEQVKTLDRYGKRVVLLYDADEAGGRAAVRGMDRVLQQGMGAYAVELPDGDDPDSFVRSEGGEAFREYIEENRLDLPAFKHRRARREGRMETPEDRVEAQRDIIASVARIPDPNLQREYVRRTSDVVDVPDSDLFRMLEKEREKLQKEQARRRRRERKRNERAGSQSESDGGRHADGGGSSRGGSDRQEAPHPADGAGSVPADAEAVAPPQQKRVEDQPMPEEKVLLRLMLDHGTSMVEFILGNMALDEFTAGAPRKTIQAFIQMYQDDRVRPQQILEGRFGDKLQRLGASVMVDEHQLSENWARNSNIAVPRLNNDPFEAAASAMTLLKLDRVNETIQEHKRRMRRADQEGNDDKMRTLQQKMMSLYELRKHIENREYLDRDPRHEPR
mgnify:FL=1